MYNQSYFGFDYYYKIYLDKCRELAKSIVVKFDYHAESMNQYIEEVLQIPVDRKDKRTWRYYKNLCGEYHYLDEMMTVVSVDTQEEIEFTKENLKLHRATRKAYEYNTRLYVELLARYPTQEALILGILYPADMEKAIKAEDGEILSYPPHLVEVNEYTLLSDLKLWIDGYLLKTGGVTYGFSDELWELTRLGLFYLNLLPAIITIRKSKCKTNEAHSYHVRRYLTSHGFLDEYLDVMTLRQSLRFYMNINWIERNPGKKDTFQWLIKEALTARKIPISEYNYQQSSEKQPKEIYAENVFTKTSLNGLEVTSELDNLSTEELMFKEDPLAMDNPIEREDHLPDIDRTLHNSLSNFLKTKVLESKMTDYSDADLVPLSKTLFNLWAFLSSQGRYRSIIYFTDPVKGKRLSLRAREAFVLYLYLYYKSYGLTLPHVPDVFVENIPREEVVTPLELKQMGETKRTKGDPNYNEIEDSFIDKILEKKPILPKRIISIGSFYETATEVNKSINDQLTLAYHENNYVLRGYKVGSVHRLYSDRWAILSDKKNPLYSTWLEEQSLDLEGYSRRDLKRMAISILKEATGVNLNTKKSVRAIHTAMINLLKQLSSYSIQFIRETNESNLLILNLIPPTPGLLLGYGEAEFPYELPVPEIIDADGYGCSVVDGSNIIDRGDGDADKPKDSPLEDPNKVSGYGEGEVNLPTDITPNIETLPISLKFVEVELDIGVPNSEFDEEKDYYDKWAKLHWRDLTAKRKTHILDIFGHDYRWKRTCEDAPPPIRIPKGCSSGSTGFRYETKIPMVLKGCQRLGHGFRYVEKVMNLKPCSEPSQGFKYQEKKIELKDCSDPSLGFKYQEKG